MMELQLWFADRHRPNADQELLLLADPEIPTVLGDYSPQKKYNDEWQILGLSVRRHIMAVYRKSLATSVDIDSRGLSTSLGRRVRIAGVLEARRATHTQNCRTIHFLTLDDEFGLFEVTLFTNDLRTGPTVPNHYGPYIIVGRTDCQYDTITVSAQSVSLYDSKATRLAS